MKANKAIILKIPNTIAVGHTLVLLYGFISDSSNSSVLNKSYLVESTNLVCFLICNQVNKLYKT